MRAALVVCLCAAACAGAPASPGEAGAPASPGAPAPEQLYRQRCAGCHRPYAPSSRSRAEWEAVLPRMAPKAHLSPEQEATLRHWLAAHASDAIPK